MKFSKYLIFITILLMNLNCWFGGIINFFVYSPCSNDKINEVMGVTEPNRTDVLVDCSLNLTNVNIRKRLKFNSHSSNMGVVCSNSNLNGGIIISNEGGQAPHDISIEGCKINGTVSVTSMNLFERICASRDVAHFVDNIRNAAPKKITLKKVTIENHNSDSFIFLQGGVSEFKLIDSTLLGSTKKNSVIYLDHESHHNTFIGNKFHVKTGEREIIAVDGSSYNLFMNNYFSGLNHGGIYLYRNCGQPPCFKREDNCRLTTNKGNGIIRHRPPVENQFINNIFYYNVYTGSNPAIYIGSRNGRSRAGSYPSYCEDDVKMGFCPGEENAHGERYTFGSSGNNHDFARYNVVMQNQIFKRSITDMIQSKNWDDSWPAYIDFNTEFVTQETVVRNRKAGCYVKYGIKNFILDGESIEYFINADNHIICGSKKLTCNNGVTTESDNSSCSVNNIEEVPLNCGISNDIRNTGRVRSASCTGGRRILTASATCNLENQSLSSAQTHNTLKNMLKVAVPSAELEKGNCFIGSNNIKQRYKIVSHIDGASTVNYGCREHDKNGGDCLIRGTLYCK